jgi:chromosome segregation ATPase
MIKFQNKKIQELQEEIDKRDQKLQSLLTQVASLEGYKFEMENFKRQTNVLEEKVKLYETDIGEKAKHLSEQLVILSESEGKLRNQVIAKDKVIMELENGLNDQDIIIQNLNKQLLERDDGNKVLKGETNELLSKFRTTSKRLEMKEEEFRRHSQEKDDNIKQLSTDKACLEDKLNQILEIIKQYSKELNELNQKVYHYEFEYKALKQLNDRQNEEIEKLIKDNNSLQKSLNKYKDINSKVDEAENVMYEFETLLKNERLKYESLSRNNNELLEKYQLLRDKVSGENNPDNLKSIIDERLIEINKLNSNIDGLTKTNKQFEQANKELEQENKELIGTINNDLISIIQWIETYLGNFYESNFNIPEITISISKGLKNKLNLDLLKETLMQTRKRASDEYNKMLIEYNKQKSQIAENTNKIDLFTTEVANLKFQVTQRDDDIRCYNEELDNYRINISTNKDNVTKLKQEISDKQDNFNRFLDKISHVIKSELDKAYRNEYLKLNSKDYKYTENLQNDIEYNLDRLVIILNALINGYDIIVVQNDKLKWVKPEYERVKKELNDRIKQHNIEMNRLITEKDEHIQIILHEKEQKIKAIEDDFRSAVNMLNSNLSEKEDFILQLQQENILMNAYFETNNNNNLKTQVNTKLNENFVINDKLKESYRDLEIKYKNLLVEIELKDRHIKSQEQMITRHAQEVEEIKRYEKSMNSIAHEGRDKTWEVNFV